MGLNIHLLNVAAFRFCVLEDACFRAKQTRTNSLSIAIGVPSKISGELFLAVMFFYETVYSLQRRCFEAQLPQRTFPNCEYNTLNLVIYFTLKKKLIVTDCDNFWTMTVILIMLCLTFMNKWDVMM